MKPKPTDAQRRVLVVLRELELSGEPYLPTIREAMRKLGFSTPAAVAYHLTKLRDMGLVLPQSALRRPGIALTSAGLREVRQARRALEGGE